MKRLPIPLALATVLAAAPLTAQSLPTASPEEVGMSTERLARIGETFQGYVDEGRIAGAVGLVARRGRLVYSDAWGYRDLEAGDRLEADDIFGICSMTKVVTSVAVMMLYEEGHFGLNDPAFRFLPELRAVRVADSEASDGPEQIGTVPAQRRLTVADLLSHMSGLTYGSFSNTVVDQAYRLDSPTAQEDLAGMMTRLEELPLAYQPGQRWHYSIATDVLGRLVEVVSGQSFGDFLQERIFEPLGMDDTSFEVPGGKRDRLARTYGHQGAQRELTVSQSYGCIRTDGFESGGAGLASTAGDYLRFAQMLLNGGELEGARILSPTTIDLMTLDRVGDRPRGFLAPGWGFGLGVTVRTEAGRDGLAGSVGEFNWFGVAGTGFTIDPEEEMVTVFMVQILPNRDLNWRNRFRQLAYQAIAN